MRPHSPQSTDRARPPNRGMVWIPIALIVIITVADVMAPEDVHLGPLLVVAPALTASFGGSRLTALIGVLATLALLTISVVRSSVTTSNHLTQLIALIAISAFTVFFCRLRERHSEELRQVRSVAQAAQHVVLQPLPTRIGPLQIAFSYQAAADQALIGGDLYAAVRTRNGTRLLIGDVRGKGLTAIDDAGLLLGAFRSAAHHELPLPALHAELEETVCWALSQPARRDTDADESFITAALVDIPDDEPVAHVLNTGHLPPLRLHAGHAALLRPSRYEPPIGVCLPAPSSAANDTFAFEAGDTLLLYTDGVTEARDATGRFYPLTDRVTAFLADDPDRLLTALTDDLLHHACGTLGDDAALVAVRRDPTHERPQRGAGRLVPTEEVSERLGLRGSRDRSGGR